MPSNKVVQLLFVFPELLEGLFWHLSVDKFDDYDDISVMVGIFYCVLALGSEFQTPFISFFLTEPRN